MGLDVSHVVPALDTYEDRFLEYFTLEELSAFADYIRRHNHFIAEKEEEEGKVRVIYFREVGYQRKGMSSKFCKDFENGKPYLDIETFKMLTSIFRLTI